MKFGINIKYLTKSCTLERAAKAVSTAGFEYVDYIPVIKSADWEKELSDALEIFKNTGLSVHQTHSPMFRYAYDRPDVNMIEAAFEATVRSGAKYMVVHGDEFDFENMEYSPQKALEYNHDLFAPFVKKAEDCGIKLAFETVFEDGFKNRPRFCSKAEDLKNLIESFDSSSVCCCWDFGHAGVSFGEKHPDMIRLLGKHIECMHMHDFGHGDDLHLPPFLGENNWKECNSAMKEIGYSGAYILEMVYGNILECNIDNFAKYIYNTAFAVSEL